MIKFANSNPLYLFLLVILSSSMLLTVGGLIGLVFGGIWVQLLAGISGAFGAAIGGELGHHKGFFEAKWGRSVIGGPFYGFMMAGFIAGGIGVHGAIVAVSAVLGAGIGALVSRYLLRFFVVEPPLSIK